MGIMVYSLLWVYCRIYIINRIALDFRSEGLTALTALSASVELKSLVSYLF